MKKDVKRISLERDGAYKHLSLTTAVAAHAASQVAHGTKASAQQIGGQQGNKSTNPTSPTGMDTAHHHDSTHSNHRIALSAPHHHHRTASDTGTTAPSPNSMASSAIGKTGKIYYYYFFRYFVKIIILMPDTPECYKCIQNVYKLKQTMR